MINSITIDDIKSILSKFGISVNVDKEERVTFFDNDNHEIMNVSCVDSPLSIVSSDDIKKLSSLNELVKTGTFISFQSSNKFLKYFLRLATNKDGKKVAMLDEICYQKKRDDEFIEDTRAICEKGENFTGNLNINTIIYSKNNPINITDRKEIKIEGNRKRIQFELNNRTGFLDNGNFVDGWYIPEDEISNELRSNELITILAECVGKQFPMILENVTIAKSHVGISKK